VNHNPGVLNGVLNLLPEEICRWNANEIASVEFGPLIFWEARQPAPRVGYGTRDSWKSEENARLSRSSLGASFRTM
jgi:hypothetical protein